MALTPHAVLRTRLLGYLHSVGGSDRRSNVLAALESTYAELWTSDDLLPQNTRRFETKWRNRVSFERQRLVDLGLLEARADGIWALTPRSREQLGSLDFGEFEWRDREAARREKLWEAAKAEFRDHAIEPGALRRIGVYAGARGIYADVARTRSAWAPTGVAVSFLDLGVGYANETDAGGVVYHYPRTERPGRDAAEISATERAYALGMPVFVISKAKDSAFRVVQRAYVEEIDPARRTALITFVGDDELPPPPPIGEAPFELVDDSDTLVWAKRRARPHQSRFAFGVFQRYGAACAVCGLTVAEALEAAHLRAKANRGVDDPRNGLPLCSNHHRMFDGRLFAFEPTSLRVVVKPGYEASDLGITRASLSALAVTPHMDALRDVWSRWPDRNGR